jgi:methionyl-tRNA formyltransferase
VPSLQALLDSGAEIAAVVTNPDRPAGRGMKLRPSPVKEAALERGLEVLQPTSARSDGFHDELARIRPDVAVVVAYGKILPAPLLGVPPHGFVNVHFSLLPAYRGAAPVQRALMDGVEETGVTIMVLSEGMDEGPIVARETTRVEPNETAGELGERLAASGARLLTRSLPAYLAGELIPEPQDHGTASYAPKLTSEEARIDWTRPAPTVVDHVRALNPDPVAWTTFREGRVRILRAEPAERPDLPPGVLASDEGLLVGTGTGTLRLLELQMPGKRPMEGAQVALGLRLAEGEGFR